MKNLIPDIFENFFFWLSVGLTIFCVFRERKFLLQFVEYKENIDKAFDELRAQHKKELDAVMNSRNLVWIKAEVGGKPDDPKDESVH